MDGDRVAGLNVLLDKDLLWCKVKRAGDVREETLAVRRSLISAMRHEVHLS